MAENLNESPGSLRWVAWLHAWRYWLLAGLALLIGVLLFEALHGLTRELHYAAIVSAIRETTPAQQWLAILATALSYAALTGYDWSALRYVGAVLPYPVIAQTSFIAYALGNTMGIGVLTGGAVRMRMYGAAGVEAGAISRAIAFDAVAFGFGITVVGALALLWGATAVAPVAHLPAGWLRVIAGVVVGAAAVLLWYCREARTLRLLGLTVPLPSLRVATQQLAISAFDLTTSAAVLWVLLPDAVSFPVFVGFYAIATVLGVISHVPGGLGVFEAIMLVALGSHVPTEALAGALVLYRLIYYVLPLALALALLVTHWLGSDDSGEPILPEAEKLSAATALCLYGQDEDNSLCPKIPVAHVRAQALPGGHHFNGANDKLAELIMARVKSP